ncbi:hypothetical protein NL676_025938 [Syzygium grande]|nr:hypothetical protein NL676_025938 [Syzygium grande]
MKTKYSIVIGGSELREHMPEALETARVEAVVAELTGDIALLENLSYDGDGRREVSDSGGGGCKLDS